MFTAPQRIAVSSNAASVAVRYDQAPKLIAKNVLAIFRKIGADKNVCTGP